MSFLEHSTLTTLRARPLVSATQPRRNALQITPQARMPRFPVSGEREKTSWFSLLGTLFEKVHFPTFREPVTRAQKVTVRAKDATGKEFEMTGEDLLARAFQHETDHLNGTLYISHVSPLKRDLIRRKIRKLQKLGEWQ